MGKIFILMGKSATGKDSIYKRLLESKELNLKTVVTYTTRPMRDSEIEGVEYHFVDEGCLEGLCKEGKVVEHRCYHTVHGPWHYFTAEDGQIDLEKDNYLILGTLESYEQIRNYFGEDLVIPIYIEVEDGERLLRALHREMQQKEPKYAELCRRFLADSEDFTEDKIRLAGIDRRYQNNDMDICLETIREDIKKHCN